MSAEPWAWALVPATVYEVPEWHEGGTEVHFFPSEETCKRQVGFVQGYMLAVPVYTLPFDAAAAGGAAVLDVDGLESGSQTTKGNQ